MTTLCFISLSIPSTLALPSLAYFYDSLPLCDANQSPRVSFSGALAGDSPVRLPSYSNITFANHVPVAQIACQMTYTATDLEALRQAIRSNSFLEYYIDDLPLRLYIGTVGERGWFDFEDATASSTRAICDAPPPTDERLYLLPHAHFILGRFGEDRLVSARLVTDVSARILESFSTSLYQD